MNCKYCSIELGKSRNGFSCQTCRNGLARYNMNRLDMLKLYESQNGKCALCNKNVLMFDRRKSYSGYIDHDHQTGKVRAILCHPCNTSIGYLEREKIDLYKVKEYILPVAQ